MIEKKRNHKLPIKSKWKKRQIQTDLKKQGNKGKPAN